jgi:hypothetical protein
MRLSILMFSFVLAAVAMPADAARKYGTLSFEPCSLSPERLPLTVRAVHDVRGARKPRSARRPQDFAAGRLGA